ncbi:nuclear transport factor 2 family protein [Vibrio alfacsensis]|uniref:nuclear transport factor 2 family protein n=1 Tax=Vibrio alfacsensis TaxID=1074311 RepID=UPI00406775E8
MNQWAMKFMSIVDKGVLDHELKPLLSDDVSLTFANNPPVIGAQQLVDIFSAARNNHDRIWHEIVNIGETKEGDNQGVFYVEAKANYQDGGEVITLPVVSSLRVKNGKVFDYRIYMDPGPAFTRAP